MQSWLFRIWNSLMVLCGAVKAHWIGTLAECLFRSFAAGEEIPLQSLGVQECFQTGLKITNNKGIITSNKIHSRLPNTSQDSCCCLFLCLRRRDEVAELLQDCFEINYLRDCSIHIYISMVCHFDDARNAYDFSLHCLHRICSALFNCQKPRGSWAKQVIFQELHNSVANPLCKHFRIRQNARNALWLAIVQLLTFDAGMTICWSILDLKGKSFWSFL